MKLLEKIVTEENMVLDLINQKTDADQSLLLTYINQNCFNIYINDEQYRKLIDEHFTIYNDGFGMYLFLKFLGRKNLQRFNATDLNDKILNYLNKQGQSIYIIGGGFSEQQLSRFVEESNHKFAGYYDGYFKSEHISKISQKINERNVDVIVIGMGVPKQEILAYKLSKEVKAKIIICVGYYLEFTISMKKRITPILRNKGLEWVFRLILEPKRLWKRYIVGIPVFFVNMIRVKFLNVKDL